MIKAWIAKHWYLHKWLQIKEISVYSELVTPNEINANNVVPIYRKYLYLCKKCGEFKEIRI